MLSGDARDGDPRALPELVVVDLGHRGADAVLQLGLRRAQVMALLLQGMRVGKMQLAGENADVAAGHGTNANLPGDGDGRSCRNRLRASTGVRRQCAW